jgi:hypothetical protein
VALDVGLRPVNVIVGQKAERGFQHNRLDREFIERESATQLRIVPEHDQGIVQVGYVVARLVDLELLLPPRFSLGELHNIHAAPPCESRASIALLRPT